MSHAEDAEPARYARAFVIGIALHIAYVAAEAAFGLFAGSLALLADAGHNAGDVLSLALAGGAAMLSRRRPSGRFTYGLRGSTILAALANAILLLLVTGGIAWEAVIRLLSPAAVNSVLIVAVAAAGILVNGATALLFAKGRKRDLNLKSAFLHMAADALVTFGVAAAGLVIWFTRWFWVDPAASLLVSLVIVVGTWGLLRSAFGLALHAVPEGVDAEAVRAFLAELPGVSAVHDLHIWGMSTTETALTCHLVMPGGHPGDALLRRAAEALHERFGIAHATLQIEIADTAETCKLTPEHVV